MNSGRFPQLLRRGGSIEAALIRANKEKRRQKKRKESNQFSLCLNGDIIKQCFVPYLRFKDQILSQVELIL